MRLLAAVLIAVACSTASAAAVGADKVLYIGGTLRDFPARSRSPIRVTFGAPKVEGTVNTKSDDRVVFDAGGSGSFEIPYAAISALHYGPNHGRPAPKGLVLFIPWDPTEQFTKDVHHLLTIMFRGPDSEQAVVFELGRDLVRPTLEALERRSGKTVVFENVEACIRYKTRDECAYGNAAELKGLKKVVLDPGIRGKDRDLILAALKTEPVGLEILDGLEGADIILKFESVSSPNPQCDCEGGRGEVSVTQGERQRVVLMFADRTTSVWGKKPATNFAAAFVAAFKTANGIRK